MWNQAGAIVWAQWRSARNHLPATVRSVARDGPLARVELDCGFGLTALLTKQSCEEMQLNPGDRVTAQVKAPHVHLNTAT